MGGKGSGGKPKAKRLADRIEEVLAEDEGAVEEVISGEEAETYEKYGRIRQKLGGNEAGRVKIRCWQKDGSLATLPSLPFEGFDEDVLARHYGGGRYVLTFYKGEEYLGSDIVTLDARVKAGEIDADPAAAIAPRSGNGLSPEAAMMIGQMKGFEALIASQGVMMQGLLTALAGKRGGEDRDPLDVGLKIAEIIKGAGASHEGPSVREMVGDMAETFREGIKFGQLAHAPVEKGLGDVIEQLIPPVTKALESAANQGRVFPKRPRPAAPVPAGTPQETPTVDLSKAPWLVHLSPFINEIASWAKNGWDADAYIGSMVARLPDNVLDEIEVAARDPQFIEKALDSLPAPFQAYRAWLTRALTSLKEQVQPEDGSPVLVQDDDDDDGDGGGGGGSQ